MKKKSIFTPYTFILLLLLAIVVIYMVAFLPGQTSELSALDSRYEQLSSQIDALAPYEGQEDMLYQQAEDIRTQYNNDKSLLTPEILANRIFAAANTGEINVSGLTVEDGGDVLLENGTSGHVYTANVTCDVKAGRTPVNFLRTLENTSGGGMYVSSVSFVPAGRTPEQGDDPLADLAEIHAAEQAAEQAQAQQEANIATLTEQYNTLKRRSDAALADAQQKAAQAAATGSSEDAVAAQVAADLASSLKQQLEQFATDNGLVTDPATGYINTQATTQNGSEVADTAETDLTEEETGNFSATINFYTVNK